MTLADIFQDDDVWRSISDDGSAEIDRALAAQAMMDSGMLFSPRPDVYFFLVPRNTLMVEFHTIAAKSCRGADLLRAVEKLQGFAAEQGIRKLTTLVPTTNRAARLMCRRAGMAEEGCLKKSLLRQKVLLDQLVYSFTEGDEKCQQ